MNENFIEVKVNKKMLKKIKCRIKNFILKTITAIAGAIFLLCLGAENHTAISIILFLLSGAWIALFARANGY